MAASLHHLALGAQDVRLLGDFYSGVFGLSVLKEHFHEDATLRSLWLNLSPGVLMIERSVQTLRRVEGVGAGLFLLAFRVEESERDELEARLQAWRCPVETRSEFTSYVRDPEGNRLAVSSYELPTTGVM